MTADRLKDYREKRDPSEKRLATRPEDHPLDYADFEGTSPEDEYGAGSVVVWDTGRFENVTDDDGADRRRKPATTQPESVLSGRTNDEVSEEDG